MTTFSLRMAKSADLCAAVDEKHLHVLGYEFLSDYLRQLSETFALRFVAG